MGRSCDGSRLPITDTPEIAPLSVAQAALPLSDLEPVLCAASRTVHCGVQVALLTALNTSAIAFPLLLVLRLSADRQCRDIWIEVRAWHTVIGF
jgi:hypothetical protein